MRMWLIDPTMMCNQHILGEHNEYHKFLHNWQKKHRIDGRIEGNAIEPMSYKSRHDELADEMLNRGMNHKSPLEQPDFSYLLKEQREYKVNQEQSLELLFNRCANCRELIMKGVTI